MRVVVEVDVELGLTRVVWIGTAQDVGKALNRAAVEGQIEGGTAQGLGLALMEEIQTRDGVITNASFTDYLIPTFLDMPPVVSELVEDPEPDAPYGVKGVGEPPTVVSTAAIVAAAPRRDRSRARARPRAPGRHRRALRTRKGSPSPAATLYPLGWIGEKALSGSARGGSRSAAPARLHADAAGRRRRPCALGVGDLHAYDLRRTCGLTSGATFPPDATEGATAKAVMIAPMVAMRFMVCSLLVRSVMTRE